MFVDGHTQTKYKLGTRAARPCDEVADDDTQRLWTGWWGYHPEEDTLELASRFASRKVHQYMRRVGLESKKPGRSSTSSRTTIPMRDTWLSSFESWPIFGFNTCPGRSHVTVVATAPIAWRDGSFSRDPKADQGDRIAWTVSGDSGDTRRLTGVGLSDVGPQGWIEIRPDEQGALPEDDTQTTRVGSIVR